MGEKDRTLTFSEQEAYDAVFKLRELGMVPNYSWQAVDPGKVENTGYDQGFGGNWRIKKREVVFEWKWKKPTDRIVLKLTLRGEIPLMGWDSQRGDIEMKDERAQKRWFVVGIHIYRARKVGDAENHYPEFKLEGESEVDFLFNGIKSDSFD